MACIERLLKVRQAGASAAKRAANVEPVAARDPRSSIDAYAALGVRACLFGPHGVAPSTKIEHLLPFAVGNNDSSTGLIADPIVLPPGVVCDKCNGARLSRVDQALAEWPPVSAFRTLAQVRNRKRSLVDAVEKTRWNFFHSPKDPRDFILEIEAGTGPDTRREDVARALCKVALESQYLKDPLDARHRRWDPVREAAVGGPLPLDLSMWLGHPAGLEDLDLTPGCDLTCTPDGDLKLICRVDVVGLTLHLFLGGAPTPFPNTFAWRIDPRTGQLTGPSVFKSRFRGRAASATRQRVEQRPPAGTPSGRRASRLPTHEEGITIEIQQPGTSV